jgi:hypothetical protein
VLGCNRIAQEAVEEAAPVPEEEPSWELPLELKEYQGEADDRKSLLAFRQNQQAARKVSPLPYPFPRQSQKRRILIIKLNREVIFLITIIIVIVNVIIIICRISIIRILEINIYFCCCCC